MFTRTAFMTMALVGALFAGSAHACDPLSGGHTKNANEHGVHMMSLPMYDTGNADVDFVKGMIPHHQMAVDMAEKLLKDGKDPEIRKLAEDIISAQKKEIEQMNGWLSKHEHK